MSLDIRFAVIAYVVLKQTSQNVTFSRFGNVLFGEYLIQNTCEGLARKSPMD